MLPNCPRCDRELNALAIYEDSPICRRCVIKLAVPRELGYMRDALIQQLRYETTYIEITSNAMWADSTLSRPEVERRIGALQQDYHGRLAILADLDRKIEEAMRDGLSKIKAEWPSRS